MGLAVVQLLMGRTRRPHLVRRGVDGRSPALERSGLAEKGYQCNRVLRTETIRVAP